MADNGKQWVVILSTMRSGSTLLKALLGASPDVSHLSETNFQCLTPADRKNLVQKHAEPILILKKPAWYHETRCYPRLPQVTGLKKIVLIRDAADTIASLNRMSFRFAHKPMLRLSTPWLLKRYWLPVTRQLHQNFPPGKNTMIVRYEDLCAQPLEQTARMFRFLGSERHEGTDTYSPPQGHWKWGSDDGSDTIRSLRVRPVLKRQHPKVLLDAITSSKETQDLRAALGYLS